MAGKRRFDRVLDPELSGRVSALDAGAVRALRDECREEESRLSYVRRLLHARLDIVQAEVSRRRGGGGELLDRLPHILAEHSGGSRDVRWLRIYQPDEGQPERRREDEALEDSTLARLPELTDEELETLVAQLTELERELSSQRMRILEHLDLLQEELVARYRDGRANIGEVLSPDSDA